MKLEDHVRWAIYNYPTLYRDRDYGTSRLLVLNHLFLVIGNGYEWCRDGYLVDADDKLPQTMEELPHGFFDKQLYTFHILREQWERFRSELKGNFAYLIDRSQRDKPAMDPPFRVVFEADQQVARQLRDEFQHPHFRRLFPAGFVQEAANRHPFRPYPVCQYSALVEILNGRTNSPHIENFDLVPKPDWLSGCVDVARAAVEHYQHTNNSDETTRSEQLEILEAFLQKFASLV